MSDFGPDWGMMAARKAQAVAYHNLKEIEKANVIIEEKDRYIQQLVARIRELEAKRKIGSVNFLIERGRHLGTLQTLRDVTGITDGTLSQEDRDNLNQQRRKRVREEQRKLDVPENEMDEH